MARSRNIKPGFFTNEVLGELPALTRLLFAGLWTLADREGRLEDRAKKIKAELLPYDQCDCEAALNDLMNAGFILRYETGNNKYIQILAFSEHQKPHQKEQASSIPPVPTTTTKAVASHNLGNGEPGLNLSTSSLIPDSLIQGTTPLSARETDAAPSALESFRKIYDEGSAVFPGLATRRTEIINRWIEAGADPVLDVFPEIRRAAGKDVRSWGYFTGGVMDAVATRLNPLPAGAARAGRPAEKQDFTQKMRGAAAKALKNTGGLE